MFKAVMTTDVYNSPWWIEAYLLLDYAGDGDIKRYGEESKGTGWRKLPV